MTRIISVSAVIKKDERVTSFRSLAGIRVTANFLRETRIPAGPPECLLPGVKRKTCTRSEYFRF